MKPWQPPSNYRYGGGDRYGLRQYMKIEKEDTETQCNLGDKLFETKLFSQVLRQLTGGETSKDGISDGMDSGWR